MEIHTEKKPNELQGVWFRISFSVVTSRNTWEHIHVEMQDFHELFKLMLIYKQKLERTHFTAKSVNKDFKRMVRLHIQKHCGEK